MMISQWNEQLFRWVNQLSANPTLVMFLDWMFRPIPGLHLGAFDIVVIVGLIGFIFAYYDDVPGWRISRSTWRRLGGFGLTGIFSWLVAVGFKFVFRIPRPFETLGEINTIFEFSGGDSYPSGHATVFMALAVAVYAYQPRLGIVAGVFAIIIGISRILVGVHYPFDILAGWLLGFALVKIGQFFLAKQAKNL